MPSKATVRKRGEPTKVRTKRLPDGTLLRVYVFDSKGPRGGKTVAEPVKKGGKNATK